MEGLLSKKQLEDAGKCLICDVCSMFEKGDCTRRTAKTALAYRDMLERHMWHKRMTDGNYFCIECCNRKDIGHAPDCKLAQMLKEDT